MPLYKKARSGFRAVSRHHFSCWARKRRWHKTDAVLLSTLAALALLSCSDPGGPGEESIATVEVTPASWTLAVGETLQLTGTCRDTEGHSVPDCPTDWTTSNAAVATVDGGGKVTAIAQGASTIAGSSSGKSGTASITVVVGSAEWPHEPAGFARVSERAFNALDEDGWHYEPRAGSFEIVTDPTAPITPVSVGRMTYPVGFPDGREPGNTELKIRPRPAELYLSFWVKFSANWLGHSSGTNKILFVWTSQTGGGDDESKFFFKFEGVGDGTLVPAGVAEQIGAPNETSREFFPNVTNVQVFRGQWHRIEIVLRMNTPGLPDGGLTYWVDGTLVGHYTDVRWNEPEDTNWSFIQWAPTWGGYVGQTLAQEQYQYMDHLYVSAPAH